MNPRSLRRRTAVAMALTAALLGTGCVGGPAGMIVSSVASAALRTAIEQAEKNRPTPEQLWHEAQIENLERRALSGDAEAQYQIGTYYLLLQESAAEQWICTAANHGHPKAQLQYGHWYNEDRKREDLFPFISVTPDNSTAFLWYSLAADNGEARAPHFRDSLIYAGIPDDKLARGRERLATWVPQPCGTPGTLTAAAARTPEAIIAR